MITKYIWRLGILVLCIAAMVTYDLIRKKDLTRLKEYSVIILASLLTGVFGIIMDMITSEISPEYFLYGKGIHAKHDIIIMGCFAGISAGFVLTAILVFINRKNSRKFYILKYLPFCFILSVLFAAVMGFVRYHLLSYQFEDLEIIMKPMEIRRFMTVWFIHLGIYIGGVVGVILAGFIIWKKNRSDGNS